MFRNYCRSVLNVGQAWESVFFYCNWFSSIWKSVCNLTPEWNRVNSKKATLTKWSISVAGEYVLHRLFVYFRYFKTKILHHGYWKQTWRDFKGLYEKLDRLLSFPNFFRWGIQVIVPKLSWKNWKWRRQTFGRFVKKFCLRHVSPQIVMRWITVTLQTIVW